MKNEQWTAEEFRHWAATGEEPQRIRSGTAHSPANMESSVGNAPAQTDAPKKIDEGYSIEIHSEGPRDIDPDNICPKWAIDCLVDCGILPDDRAKAISAGIHKYHRQKRGSTGKTIIIVRKMQ